MVIIVQTKKINLTIRTLVSRVNFDIIQRDAIDYTFLSNDDLNDEKLFRHFLQYLAQMTGFFKGAKSEEEFRMIYTVI